METKGRRDSRKVNESRESRESRNGFFTDRDELLSHIYTDQPKMDILSREDLSLHSHFCLFISPT